ncbi:unannotated protein [freshwater metagenome]|uniref:Unannotated protein n=1 Tax=freshwater metagenome TaxID=449393 RepID=A0A6J6VH37_9ZZZZ
MIRDAHNENITHIGSAVFAMPPGTVPDGYIGQGLFA